MDCSWYKLAHTYVESSSVQEHQQCPTLPGQTWSSTVTVLVGFVARAELGRMAVAQYGVVAGVVHETYL